MPNRNLTTDELKRANKLIDQIRKRLEKLAGCDHELLFAYRRKVAKELQYDERGKPMTRRKLKAAKHAEQGGKCAHCSKKMPLRYSELDRMEAALGYTATNTELVHAKCHQARQAAKRYT
jgi:UTP:GlnB (protein PII) uridylyltransferase